MTKTEIKKTNKKIIKKVMKKYGYTVIEKSIFFGDNPQTVIYNCFDKYGECFFCFTDFSLKTSTFQFLSNLTIHEKEYNSNWFFED